MIQDSILQRPFYFVPCEFSKEKKIEKVLYFSSHPSLLWCSIKFETPRITNASRAYEFLHQVSKQTWWESSSQWAENSPPPLAPWKHSLLSWSLHTRMDISACGRWRWWSLGLAGTQKEWDDKEDSCALQPSSTWHPIQTFHCSSQTDDLSVRSLTTAKLYTRLVLLLKALVHQNC